MLIELFTASSCVRLMFIYTILHKVSVILCKFTVNIRHQIIFVQVSNDFE